MVESRMGVLSDLYVALPAEAAHYDVDPERFAADAASGTGFTELELSGLLALFQRREWDLDLLDRFEKVLLPDDGERAIVRLPEELLDHLLKADPASLDEVVKDWAESEEMSCQPEEARPIVDDLQRLSRLARSSGRSVYLWSRV
jgi:hypothetical protein